MSRVLIAASALVLAAMAVGSLSWGLAIDAPLLAYAALGIDRFGLVPYRDLFDFNTPGAYAANIAIGKIFGYTEPGFRIADIVALTLLLVTASAALRCFGWRAALTASLLFGGFYLGYGPGMSLQREFLLLLPVALAMLAAFRWDGGVLRPATIGVALGCAATIKPQSAIVVPVFAAWLATGPQSSGQRPIRVAACIGGFLLPVAAAAAWIISSGGSQAFFDIAGEYWPLYNELTGPRPHYILHGSDRIGYVLNQFVASRDFRHAIVIVACVGAWYALRHPSVTGNDRHKAWLLVGVALSFQIYPLLAGKFWAYHWLPSLFSASMLAGLAVRDWGDQRLRRDVVPAMVLIMLAAQWSGLARGTRLARVEVVGGPWKTAHAIADVLKPRLREGDTVQPLDWTGGAAHALFLTDARIATPFLYDFYFYHHVSSPYIQALRRRFITALSQAQPAFIIAADQKRRFEGPDTTYQFAELSEILRRDYHAILANETFQVYERNGRSIN